MLGIEDHALYVVLFQRQWDFELCAAISSQHQQVLPGDQEETPAGGIIIELARTPFLRYCVTDRFHKLPIFRVQPVNAAFSVDSSDIQHKDRVTL